MDLCRDDYWLWYPDSIRERVEARGLMELGLCKIAFPRSSMSVSPTTKLN